MGWLELLLNQDQPLPTNNGVLSVPPEQLWQSLAQQKPNGPTLSLQGGGSTFSKGPVDMFAVGGNVGGQVPVGDYRVGAGADIAYARGTHHGPEGKTPIRPGVMLNGAQVYLDTPEGQRIAAEWKKQFGRNSMAPDNQYWLRFNSKF